MRTTFIGRINNVMCGMRMCCCGDNYIQYLLCGRMWQLFSLIGE